MAEKQCNLLKNGGDMSFIDTSRVLHTDNANYSTNGIASWVATEDCWVYAEVLSKQTGIGGWLDVDGVHMFYVSGGYSNSVASCGGVVPAKKGQTISSRTGNTNVSCVVTVYGML